MNIVTASVSETDTTMYTTRCLAGICAVPTAMNVQTEVTIAAKFLPPGRKVAHNNSVVLSMNRRMTLQFLLRMMTPIYTNMLCRYLWVSIPQDTHTWAALTLHMSGRSRNLP